MNNGYMRALGHPMREQILRRLLELEQASPTQLADELGAPLPNVAYHVRCLLKKGIVREADTAPRRGAIEHFYAFANADTHREIAALFAALDQLHEAVVA